MDNQITIKLWIIKTFWSVYLQDNHHFRDLNIQKRGLIFRIRIKNEAKCNSWLKNPKKKESRLDQNSNASLALLMSRLAQTRGLLDWDKPYHFFIFLEIRMYPSLYLIIQVIFRSIPISINSGRLSKFSTFFYTFWPPSFWLFFSDFAIPLTLKMFWRLLP